MTNAIAVRPGESVSGVAWVAPNAGFPELHVIGKLSFLLLADGQISLMARPELPGRNQGVVAPEEIEPAAQRRLIVHGPRSETGRVLLRRGPTPLAETSYGLGNDPVGVPLTNAMHTTVAGRRGDEWLVVEAGSSPGGRRWCKLPKLGLVAKWGDVEQLLLTSRACLVDVSTWVVAFVLRASRKLPAAMVPQTISLSLLNLSSNVGEDAVLGPATAATAPPRTSQIMAVVGAAADDDDVDRTAVREPPRAASSMLDDSADEPKTRLVDVARELPPEALRDPRDVPQRRPSSAGLRIGRTSSPAMPAVTPAPGPTTAALPKQVHDEPTAQPPSALEAGPSSVTRAFAALSPETRPPLRSELLGRIKDGARLDDLDLRGADLVGIAVPGAALGGLDLSGADLSHADLTGTDLAGARLDRARLDGARLEGADLMCASLCGASLRGCSLAAANFAGADLVGADLSGAAPASALAGAKFGR